jgi:hypothetical protein
VDIPVNPSAPNLFVPIATCGGNPRSIKIGVEINPPPPAAPPTKAAAIPARKIRMKVRISKIKSPRNRKP